MAEDKLRLRKQAVSKLKKLSAEHRERLKARRMSASHATSAKIAQLEQQVAAAERAAKAARDFVKHEVKVHPKIVLAPVDFSGKMKEAKAKQATAEQRVKAAESHMKELKSVKESLGKAVLDIQQAKSVAAATALKIKAAEAKLSITKAAIANAKADVEKAKQNVDDSMANFVTVQRQTAEAIVHCDTGKAASKQEFVKIELLETDAELDEQGNALPQAKAKVTKSEWPAGCTPEQQVQMRQLQSAQALLDSARAALLRKEVVVSKQTASMAKTLSALKIAKNDAVVARERNATPEAAVKSAVVVVQKIQDSNLKVSLQMQSEALQRARQELADAQRQVELVEKKTEVATVAHKDQSRVAATIERAEANQQHAQQALDAAIEAQHDVSGALQRDAQQIAALVAQNKKLRAEVHKESTALSKLRVERNAWLKRHHAAQKRAKADLAAAKKDRAKVQKWKAEYATLIAHSKKVVAQHKANIKHLKKVAADATAAAEKAIKTKDMDRKAALKLEQDTLKANKAMQVELKKLTDATQELVSLKKESWQWSSSDKAAAAAIDKVRAQIKAMTIENAVLNSRIGELKTKAAKRAARAKTVHSQRVALEAKVSKLRAEHQRLIDEAATNAADNSEIAHLHTTEKLLASSQRALESEFVAKSADLKASIARQTTKLAQQSKIHAELTAALQKALQANNKAQSETGRAQEKFAKTIKALKDEHKGKVVKLIRYYQGQVSKIRSDMASLKAQVDNSTRVALDKIKKHYEAETAKIDAEYARQDAKLAGAQAKIDKQLADELKVHRSQERKQRAELQQESEEMLSGLKHQWTEVRLIHRHQHAAVESMRIEQQIRAATTPAERTKAMEDLEQFFQREAQHVTEERLNKESAIKAKYAARAKKAAAKHAARMKLVAARRTATLKAMREEQQRAMVRSRAKAAQEEIRLNLEEEALLNTMRAEHSSQLEGLKAAHSMHMSTLQQQSNQRLNALQQAHNKDVKTIEGKPVDSSAMSLAQLDAAIVPTAGPSTDKVFGTALNQVSEHFQQQTKDGQDTSAANVPTAASVAQLQAKLAQSERAMRLSKKSLSQLMTQLSSMQAGDRTLRAKVEMADVKIKAELKALNDAKTKAAKLTATVDAARKALAHFTVRYCFT
jgi:hypothetical protein